MFHKSIFWHLPYGMRQKLYRVCRPGRYRMLASGLREPRKDDDMRPFLKYRCLFIHIPKTGGYSVTQALFGGITGGHRRLRDYALVFTREQWDSYFRFSIVRNPWMRAYSAYRFLKSGGWGPEDQAFNDQVLSRYDGFEDFALNWMTPQRIRQTLHFFPQHLYLCVSSSKPEVDFIARTEQLEKDFPLICERLGLNVTLPKLNQSPLAGKDPFDKDVVEHLGQLYAEDIALLNYEPPSLKAS